MTSLPKRGDRVRVTEVSGNSKLNVGDELTLEMDALQHHDDWVYFDFVPVRDRFPVFSGAVKVEVLERATTDTFTLTCRKCGRSMRLEAGPMKRADTTIDECALCDEKRAEFARGMRRAVEIATRLCDPSGQQNSAPTLSLRALREAVEKELEP